MYFNCSKILQLRIDQGRAYFFISLSAMHAKIDGLVLTVWPM